MNKRSFLKACAKTAAIIALAPQLCFRVRAELPKIMPHEREVLARSGLLISTIYATASGGTLGLYKQTPEENVAWESEWFDKLGLKYRLIEYHYGPHDGDVITLRSADIPRGERDKFWEHLDRIT